MGICKVLHSLNHFVYLFNLATNLFDMLVAVGAGMQYLFFEHAKLFFGLEKFFFGILTIFLKRGKYITLFQEICLTGNSRMFQIRELGWFILNCLSFFEGAPAVLCSSNLSLKASKTIGTIRRTFKVPWDIQRFCSSTCI
jgi:hypothetical protein